MSVHFGLKSINRIDPNQVTHKKIEVGSPLHQKVANNPLFTVSPHPDAPKWVDIQFKPAELANAVTRPLAAMFPGDELVLTWSQHKGTEDYIRMEAHYRGKPLIYNPFFYESELLE